MRKLIFLPILFFTFIALFSSCKKEECTGPNATNFKREAKKDDGSCIYPAPPNPMYGNFDATSICIGNVSFDYTLTVTKEDSIKVDFYNINNWGTHYYGNQEGNHISFPSDSAAHYYGYAELYQ